MCEKVKCSIFENVTDVICPRCQHKYNMLLGTNSYIELFCNNCKSFFYICTKREYSDGTISEKVFFDHEFNDTKRRYFVLRCITFTDEIMDVHLGENSYLEFICPYCNKKVAIKTTNTVKRYVSPRIINKDIYRCYNRVY